MISHMLEDTVNQVGKIALGLIKNASVEINNIAKQRINQIIRQGGAIEDMYQTPFGKQQLNKLKNKILR